MVVVGGCGCRYMALRNHFVFQAMNRCRVILWPLTERYGNLRGRGGGGRTPIYK